MKKTIFTLLILLVCVIQSTMAYEYFTIYFSDGTKSEAFYATDVDSICYSKIGLDSIIYEDWQVQEIYTIDSVYRYPLAIIDSLSFKDVDVNKSLDILDELFSITPNGQQLEIEDVITYVKKHFDNANIEIRDSIIYLDIEGCETLRLDIYGKSMMGSSDWVLDTLALSNRIDSIMHVLGRDVPDTISTIFSDSIFSEDIFNNSESKIMNYRRAANVTNSPTILTNNNLLIWSPWYYTESRYEHKLIFETINTFANNLNKRRPEAMKLSPTQADGASLANIASMRTFSNYDVVFIDCHGTENGELIMPITTDTEIIPGDIVGIKDNSTKKIVPGKVLDEKHMRRYLPKRLDHTILFTAMCYAYPTKNRQSLLYKIATERKVADYMGATNSVTVRTPLDRFVNFATTFFLGGTPTTKAFNGGPYIDKFIRDDKVITASGQYKHARIVDDVFYGFARPLPYNKQNHSMKGRMPLPQNYLSQAHSREGFRSAKSISSNFTNDNIEAGFMLKNLTTGDVQSIPLTKDNVTDYQIYPLGNIMADVVFEVKTDRLKPGRYAYSTYIWNGESLKLSNDAQEFTIVENAEPYYVWDEAKQKVTYYYDGYRYIRNGTSTSIIPQRAISVIFDSSFSNYYPKIFKLYNCNKLQKIDNIKYLNTDSIIDMNSMFSNCSSLISLDLSNFNTSRVTDMGRMFYGCSSMTSLDLSSFNTINVQKIYGMFSNCSSMTSLDLSSFVTSNVNDMAELFYGCISLTSLDLSSFDTSNVNFMSGMFDGCSNLTILDLSSFKLRKHCSFPYMFCGCNSLRTIYAGNWNLYDLYVFSGCYNLVGGKGTKIGENFYGYDKNGNPLYYDCPANGRAAHIDGGKDNPGLFTEK